MSSAATTNPLDEISRAVGPSLDLWQPRDWPHRRGDDIRLDLHSMPLSETSPGHRSVPCENCGQSCLIIHDNVLCWKCKGCFCYHCTSVTDEAYMMSVQNLLERGFGKCHNCREPLRSIALIDVMRMMMEQVNDNPESINRFLSSSGSSLVEEAEDALKRAYKAEGRDDKAAAIFEYTHAINAINYLTSSSLGDRLVLRAKDLLLICHCERAYLEGNNELRTAILNAYPNASYRIKKGETEWFLSKSAFESLFYPLPADAMVGSSSATKFFQIDTRTQSKRDALEKTHWKEQLDVAKLEGPNVPRLQACLSALPNVDGIDPQFDDLNGTWKGVVNHYAMPMQISDATKITLGNQSFTSDAIVQFIYAFRTDYNAKKYAQFRYEQKRIGEERAPLHAKDDPANEKKIKKKLKGLGVTDFQKLKVIKAAMGPYRSISVILSIKNVCTKIFAQTLGGSGSLDPVCYYIAKAVYYLDQQLQLLRSTDKYSLLEAPHHHPDLTICAFCGGAGKSVLKTCSRCKLAKYCSVNCQKKHWEKAGPFGHKSFCKQVVKHTKNKG